MASNHKFAYSSQSCGGYDAAARVAALENTCNNTSFRTLRDLEESPPNIAPSNEEDQKKTQLLWIARTAWGSTMILANAGNDQALGYGSTPGSAGFSSVSVQRSFRLFPPDWTARTRAADRVASSVPFSASSCCSRLFDGRPRKY